MFNAHIKARLILVALLLFSFQLEAQQDSLLSIESDSLTIAHRNRGYIIVETGPVLSNQVNSFNNIDLDGPANIYGETDIIMDGYFINLDMKYGVSKLFALSGGYSMTRLNKSRLAEIGDTLSVDDQYPLIQHEFYINSTIHPGKGFEILPAVNIIIDSYETVMPEPGIDSSNWLFPVEKQGGVSTIAYLSVSKHFKIVSTKVFTAFSNLGEEKQFQAGIQFKIDPFGNQALVMASAFLNHRDAGTNHFIFDQTIDIRISKKVYTGVTATFGEMNNYYESHARKVYNLFNKLTFKGSARLIIEPVPRLKITGEYRYLAGEGSYFYYENLSGGENQDPAVTNYKDFLSQVYLIGIKWAF